jgi:hypothetical protein
MGQESNRLSKCQRFREFHPQILSFSSALTVKIHRLSGELAQVKAIVAELNLYARREREMILDAATSTTDLPTATGMLTNHTFAILTTFLSAPRYNRRHCRLLWPPQKVTKTLAAFSLYS